MMIAAALAALAHGSIATRSIDLRIIRSTTSAHVLRLTYDVRVAGVRGKEVGIYDLDDGRSVERLEAGALSSSSGFDGTRSWSADATGMPSIEDHPNTLLDDLAAAHFTGRTGPERPAVYALRSTRTTSSVRLRYAGLKGPIDVTLAKRDGRIDEVDDFSQPEPQRTRYRDYRTRDGFVIPFETTSVVPERTSVETVRSVAVLRSVPAMTFAPPPEPHDWSLSGDATTVSMGDLRDNEPIVDVRIDGGRVLHMLFDTGSSNTMSTRTARRLGLALVGRDRTGGIGTALLPQRYARVREMRIGTAAMRDQIFAVFDDVNSTTDGSIGCEVLQRFAVRFDFPKHAVTLARDVGAYGLPAARDAAIPMQLEGCEPEIHASFDGFSGAFGIDTGSGSALDVMAPFVRVHRLVQRYRAKVHVDGGGIGGFIVAGSAYASVLDIGSYHFDRVPIELSTMRGGAFNDATQVGNVGVGLLAALDVIFDYRKRRMWLR